MSSSGLRPPDGYPITRHDADGVKAIRARTGLTQAQFADRLGVTVDTVRSWETGRRTPAPALRPKLIAMSRPASIGMMEADEQLRQLARTYDANAIALEVEGEEELAGIARQMGTALHRLAGKPKEAS
jgi:transcriptional regulator with XRE-family HTH domain